MPEGKPLHEIFLIAERFQRSVNIALDYKDDASLAGYIITPLSKAVLSRILVGLTEPKNRSWSITGPYGAGKSACMLLMAQALGYPPRPAVRAMLQEREPELYRQIQDLPGLGQGGFVIVPMVCGRQPLSLTLLGGLLEALGPFEVFSEDLTRHVGQVRALYERVAQGDNPVPSAEIAEVVERTARLLHSRESSILGMILILDELGKSLEYAALHPERGDIELLQILAELASRLEKPTVGLLTVLHQAFEHYTASLSPTQQREWSKVQGRFEDIGFLESAGELLNLVSESIQPLVEIPALNQVIADEVHQAEALEILPRELGRDEALRILAGCAPLHPSVALVLGPLFRSRLAQNERSLFAFLCSGEPHGFQDYLHSETWSNNGYHPFYRLDRLYDYVVAALGSGLYLQAQGKRWAEIEEALARLPNEATELEARLVKVIGMLGLLGDQRYLRASKAVLVYALADGRIGAQDIGESLRRLEAWNIVIYRRFKDAYSLWQGSDVDLDVCFERGIAHLDRSIGLAHLLQKGSYLKPYVAKRHLHETGTFRFLAPWVVDLEQLESVRDQSYGEADGALVFILPSAGIRADEATDRVVRFSAELPTPRRGQTLFAILHHTQGIREALEEVTIWQWVAENTPELEGDSIARRELSARHLAARERLERALSRCFDLAASYASCIWVWQGQVQSFASARELASFLSDVCDSVYANAPIIRNELINRRSLSSAVAAARRVLIERMLTHSAEENLALTGYPPEMSIYLSVLKASGLHRVTQARWSFGPPDGSSDPCRVRPLWEAIDAFLATTEREPRPVTELFDLLKRPPFGIREGPLPIYLAAYMIHNQAEIALYEEGTFVPQVGIAEFERLMRAPQRFTLQRYRLTNQRARLLDGYIRLFNPKPEPGQVTILNAVRALMVFAARLPRYAHLTEDLSEDARAIRKALISAREPQPLLFRVLPAALGFTALDDTPQYLEAYLARLRKALLELQRAYDRLLTTIERELLDALRLPADLSVARQEITQRVIILGDWLSDPNVRAFALRLSDTRLAEREWLESLAALVAGKSPANWSDADLRTYRFTLAELAGKLRRVEEVALSKGKGLGPGHILRIGIMDGAGHELRELLHIAPEQEPGIWEAANALEEKLRALGLGKREALMALAQLAKQILSESSNGDDPHEP